MQVNCAKLSNTERELQVEIPAADFDKYLEKAASAMSADLEVQGFRKGHIPINIVEQKVGSSVLYNEAAELAVQATYEEAFESAGKDISAGSDPAEILGAGYAVPEVQVTKLAPGNPFVYKVILKAPSFELTQEYKNTARKVVEKEAKEIRVEKKEVDDTLKWLAQKRQQGDEGFKKSVREGIYLEKEKKEKERVRLKIVKAIIAKSYAEIPEKVIDQEILKIEEEFRQNIAHMSLNFEEYLTRIKKTKEELREGWRDQAKERVEIALVLEAIASRESIEPDDKEVGDEVQKILNRFKSADEAKKNIDPVRVKSYVRGILKNEKTFKFLESL